MIELLVVMVIIGLLASIAIPILLTQRQKAHDAAVKEDVSSLGKEVMTYFVGGAGPLSLDFATAPGSVILTDGSYLATVKLSKATTVPLAGGSAHLDNPSQWCVSLTDPGGAEKDFKYSAHDSLGKGTCP